MKTAFIAALAFCGSAWAQGTVYRCPGSPESYTNLLTAQEAKDKGCRTIDGAPITVVAPTARPKGAPPSLPASGPRDPQAKVDPNDQKARDNDARRILAEELRREEDRLAQLQREFNNGEPERRGDEKNYARYQDRVAEMKAAIARKEADIAALRREMAKLGGTPAAQ